MKVYTNSLPKVETLKFMSRSIGEYYHFGLEGVDVIIEDNGSALIIKEKE